MVWWKPRTWARLRLVTTTTREPEWDNDDFQLLFALDMYEADLHTCGHPLTESTSPYADADNPKSEYIYKAQLPVRCHACTALEKMKAGYSGDNYDPSLLWVVEKVNIER